MKKALFIDRDGTINVDHGYTCKASDLELYLDAVRIIKQYNRKGYLVIVTTNQSGIGRGYYSEKEYKGFNSALAKELEARDARVDAFYHCPHTPQDRCNCRKPNAGMIKRALKDYDIDLSGSIVIGDRDEVDGEMARRMGMRYRILRRKPVIKYNNLKTALILAGGKGTRLLPITRHTPKPLVMIDKNPTIYYIIKELREGGIRDFYFSVGYKADRLIDYLDKLPKEGCVFHYVVERTRLGTGGAVKLAINRIAKDHEGDILVVNGDDLFRLDIKKMYTAHLNRRALITMACRRQRDLSSSGVLLLKRGRILGFFEKPAAGTVHTDVISTGKYIMNLDIIGILPDKKSFMLEHDFFAKLNYKREKIFGFVSSGSFYPTDTLKRLEVARKNW